MRPGDGPHRGRDTGSVALEMAVLAPVLLLFVLMVIFGGRWAIAQQAVQAAAAEAARTASLARSAAEASGSATTAATAALANQQLRCATVTVALDSGGFTVPEGTPATVTATVTCVVDMGDLAAPGIPGSRTLTATMSSPLDTYRNRQG